MNNLEVETLTQANGRVQVKPTNGRGPTSHNMSFARARITLPRSLPTLPIIKHTLRLIFATLPIILHSYCALISNMSYLLILHGKQYT